jgi:serine/threonine protein kinase
MPEPKVDDVVKSPTTTYKIARMLNSGAEGTACLARNAAGQRVFLKFMQRETPASDKLQKFAFREWQLELGRKLREIPSFVSVTIEFFEQAHHYWRADQFVDGQSLETRLRAAESDPSAYPQEERQRDAKVMAFTLTKIHEYRVVHSDLKPDNVMVQAGTRGAPSKCVIVDFDIGFVAGKQPLQAGYTPGYGAPEHLVPGLAALSTAVDVFSLGCILYELLLYGLPWPNNWEADCVAGRFIPPADAAREMGLRYDSAMLQTLGRCLAARPSERPTAATLHRSVLKAFATPAAPPPRPAPAQLALVGSGGRIALPRTSIVDLGRNQFLGWPNAESVSRTHIRIGRDRGLWCLWHVSPTNPTIVIRRGIEQVISRPGYREPIQPGDRLRLGRLEVEIVGN